MPWICIGFALLLNSLYTGQALDKNNLILHCSLVTEFSPHGRDLTISFILSE